MSFLRRTISLVTHKSKRPITGILSALTLLPLLNYAQSLTSSISSDTIRIGEPLELRYQLSFPQGSLVLPPSAQTICKEPFEALTSPATDTLSKPDHSALIYTLSVTSFDSGNYVIPAVSFQIFRGADTLTIYSDSFHVSVLTVPVDTTEAFRDIKGPLAPPFDWRDLLPYLLAALLAALLTFSGIMLWRKYRRKKTLKTTDIVLTPAEKALQALKNIRMEKLWLTADDKTYYSRLTDVLRIFFEEQFGFKAPEMVSSEIMDALRLQGTATEWMRRLEQLFIAADMAKFAKAKPSEAEKERALQAAEEYVRLYMTNPAPSQNQNNPAA